MPRQNPIIVAAGSFPPLEWARPRLQQAPLLIAADAGWRLCQACGVLPQLLIGDLDSLHSEEIAQLPPLPWGISRHPVHKDQSDLELALEALAQRYQGPVDLWATLGGRLDHQLFNLCALLFRALDLGLQARVVDPQVAVYPLRQHLELRQLQGSLCSILALGQNLESVTLEGFRYPLQQGRLSPSSTLGLSNLIEESVAKIWVGQGQGLVIITRSEEERESLCW